MKNTSSFIRDGGWATMTIAVVVSVFAVVSLASATSTISTNISTGGTLAVTGASTLTGAVTASATLAVTGASTLTGGATVGSSGTALVRVNSGFCNVQSSTNTITASTTKAIDCGGGTYAATALTGITAGDRVLLGQPTTTSTVFGGLQILGASASTTQGFITLIVANNTGFTFTWTAAASTSWPYLVVN